LIAIVDNLLILASFIEVREEAFPVQLKSEKATKKPGGKAALRECLGMLLLLIG